MTDYRTPDNLTPYRQGRADQRRIDRIVAIACLVALAIYMMWGE